MRGCPICKSEVNSVYIKKAAWNNREKKTELRKCAQCNFIFSAEPQENLDQHYRISGQEYLDLSYDDIKTKALDEGIPQLVREITSYLELDSGRLLDFGCGIGKVALIFKENGWDVFGVEPCEISKNLHEKLCINTSSNLSTYNNKKGKFDLIIMKDVLEHLLAPVETLKELIPLLKPGGYFYVRVPNVIPYAIIASLGFKRHINHFSPKTLDNLLLSLGLKKRAFINVYDVRSKAGRLYHSIFWKTRYILPLYHQISLLYRQTG